MLKSFNKITRPLLAVLVGVPMMLTTQGCTDEEVATGLGTVAIIAGAVAIGAAAGGGHHSHSSCHGGYKRECTTYRDRWGGVRRDCRQVYDSCLNYYDAKVNIPGLSVAPAAPALDATTARIASRYGISFEAAELLTTSLNEARAGRTQAIYDLGLAKSDLEQLAQVQMISDSGVNSLAAKLDLSNESARALVQGLLKDVKAQAADSKSAYWQSCTQSGKWKTPQNLSCERTWWSGCSPETGATLCMAAN